MPDKAKPLTPRERKLFQGLLAGKPITDAAREAGYSSRWAGQAGSRALANIKVKAPNLFERLELDDDTFVEECIKPPLFATEIKVARVGDGTKQNPYRFVYSKPLIAWAPRIATNRLVAEMKGLIVKEPEIPNAGIRVILINQAHRPPNRAPCVEIPQMPGIPAPGKPN